MTQVDKFGEYKYTQDEVLTQQILLNKKLGRNLVSTRTGPGGSKLTYISGFQSIEIANQIFGFNGWSDEIVELTQDFIEKNDKGNWTCSYSARVRVSLKDGTFHEDIGVGEGNSQNRSLAIETAKKSAVTDARKRALKTFGNVLGNSLYDRTHLNNLMKKVKTEEDIDDIEDIKSQTYSSMALSSPDMELSSKCKVFSKVKNEIIKRKRDTSNNSSTTGNGAKRPIGVKNESLFKIEGINNAKNSKAEPLFRIEGINNRPNENCNNQVSNNITSNNPLQGMLPSTNSTFQNSRPFHGNNNNNMNNINYNNNINQAILNNNNINSKVGDRNVSFFLDGTLDAIANEMVNDHSVVLQDKCIPDEELEVILSSLSEEFL